MFSSLSPARRRALIWMVLGVLTLLLLAGGLGTFKMEPGKVFAFPQPTQAALAPAGGDTLPGGDVFLTIMRGALAVLLILVPISLVAALFSREGRRRLIINILLIGMFYLLAQQIQKVQKEAAKTPQPAAAAQELKPGIVGGEPLPPPPPAPSDELVLIASIVLVVAGIGLAAWLGRRLLFPVQAPLAQIAKEAERGRSALAGGEALEDAIVRTYRQMSRIVAEARELRRPAAATPREFEEILEDAGLPAQPLAVLTRLFEDVRYGGFSAGPQERQAAIDCLTAIAAACRAGDKKRPRRAVVQNG